MRTKGKPSCGGTGCDPCNSDTNPCFVLTVEDPVTIVLDEAPTDYTVEPMEEFLPADLPRDLRYVCLWNSTTGKYECSYHTPGPTDTEHEVSIVAADRHAGDVAYRSVTYDSADNNLCEGDRWYGGASAQYPSEHGGSVFVSPDECEYVETGATSSLCNWGVLPGHVGDMSTGPWSPTTSFPFRWRRVTVGGVPKVQIAAGTAGDIGWFGETDFYRAGSTPTAPIFWWPIPADDPIRLEFTPTLQYDGSAPLDDPLSSAESFSFRPWPDILLTSCDNTGVPDPCDDFSCWPPCMVKTCTGSSDPVVGDTVFVNIDGTDFALTYNETANKWERTGFGDFEIEIFCDGAIVPGIYQLLISIDAIFGAVWTGGWLASCTDGVLDPLEFTVSDGMGTDVLIVVHQ